MGKIRNSNNISERYIQNWKNIQNYIDFYMFSNDGLVKSLARYVKGRNGSLRLVKERILKTQKNKKGYMIVGLNKNGKRKTCLLHRLICTAFHGPCPKGMECLHKDGKKWNNHESNLHWGTRKENLYDKIAHGTSNRGERCGRHKLTKLQINEIRELYKTGNYTQKKLAEMFNVCFQNISFIVNYINWKY